MQRQAFIFAINSPILDHYKGVKASFKQNFILIQRHKFWYLEDSS